MKRKAFTLIEVMVVLSILAIIAILAYNFFGSTSKEATLTSNAVKFWRAASTLDAAAQEYYRKNNAWPANTAALVTAGIIKSVPEVPTGGSWTFRDNTRDMGGPTTATDVYWEWANEASGLDEMLTAMNEKYTSLGATLPDSYATPNRADGIWGYKAGTTPGIIVLLESK